MNPQNQDQPEKFRKEEPPPIPDWVPPENLIVCIGLKAYFNIGESKKVKDSKAKK